MRYTVPTKMVCAKEVSFDLNDGIVSNVEFVGGCNGNLKAIAKLVDGRSANEIVKLLLGNTCGAKTTSCADQFAKAIISVEKRESLL